MLKAADIAILNQETILGGEKLGFSGFPIFNSPQEIGDAAVSAGVDVMLSATNHTLDKGYEGIQETLKYWRENHPDMLVPGIADSQEVADTPALISRNGITVAVLNYAESTNGLPVPADHPYCIKRLHRSDFAADVQRAREAGADVVIACPHWGNEYVYTPNSNQRNFAGDLIEAGVDAIIGTHPHVLEPLEIFDRSDGTRVPVFWSIGNFISRQLEAPRTVGGMAGLSIEKRVGSCAITACSLEPTIMHKGVGGGTDMCAYMLADYSDELTAKSQVDATDDFPAFTVEGCHDFVSMVLGTDYDRTAGRIAYELNPLAG